MPPLAPSGIGLIHAPGKLSAEAAALAEAVRATVGAKPLQVAAA
jgi:hypothetical protein